jgi:hypothetical protein
MAHLASISEIVAAYRATSDPDSLFLALFEGAAVRQAPVTAHIRRNRGDATRTAGARALALARIEARRLKAERFAEVRS